MPSKADIPVEDWLRQLAEETAAFSIEEVAAVGKKQAEGMWNPELVAKLFPIDNGPPVPLEIEVKSRITPAEALGILGRMKATRKGSALVLCCPAISRRVRELCRERGIGYLDEAGNCRISVSGFFLQIEGRRNARPDTRPTVDIFAPKSSRIARILLTHPKRGWQVQALAKEARVSLGLASKTKRALVELAFAETREGLIYPRDARQLLQAWAARYDISKMKRLGLYTLNKLLEVESRIGQWCVSKNVRYALTQFSGSSRIAPMVRYRRSSIYVESRIREMISDLGFKPVRTGANLIVWTPYDASVFYDTRNIDDLNVVSPIQLYLDLIADPSRGEEAALEVLEKEIKPTW